VLSLLLIKHRSSFHSVSSLHGAKRIRLAPSFNWG
jgi:hypothetical protein